MPDTKTNEEVVYPEIEINLSRKEKLILMTNYIQTHMSPPSIQTFQSELKSGAQLEIALYNTVLNEIVNISLRELIEGTEANPANPVDPRMTEPEVVGEYMGTR